jgi:hypothetical protein
MFGIIGVVYACFNLCYAYRITNTSERSTQLRSRMFNRKSTPTNPKPHYKVHRIEPIISALLLLLIPIAVLAFTLRHGYLANTPGAAARLYYDSKPYYYP